MTIDQPLQGAQERTWSDLLAAAADLVVLEQLATVSRLQRRLEISHDRAAAVMRALQEHGVVGVEAIRGASRYVLATPDQLPEVLDRLRVDEDVEAVP